jgi:uncharacterized membrane protein (DUF485 family)
MADVDMANVHSVEAGRSRMAFLLSAIVVMVTCVFLVLVAYFRPFMSQMVAPGWSLTIVLGALMFVLAWVVTGIYVFWANGYYKAVARE